jgi:hypothetical protein
MEFGPGEVSLLPPGHDAWVVGKGTGRGNRYLRHGDLRESGLSPLVPHLCSVGLTSADLALDSPHCLGRATKGVSCVSVGRWFWIVCTFCSAWLTAALSGKKV